MKHVWQIFLFLAVLVSVCCTGCERKQAMEIEEETFPGCLIRGGGERRSIYRDFPHDSVCRCPGSRGSSGSV